jgi:hypothetical protein
MGTTALRQLQKLVMTAAIVAGFWNSFCPVASAAKDDYSVFFFFGEAWGPGNVRVGFPKFDLGLELRSPGLYGGPRLWLGQAYIGTGPFLSFQPDTGLYGLLGYEMSLFRIPLLRIAGEFWAIGTILGRTYAVGTIGLGVAW